MYIVQSHFMKRHLVLKNGLFTKAVNMLKWTLGGQLSLVCTQTMSVGQVYRLVLRAHDDNFCVHTLAFTSTELAKSNLPEGFQENDSSHLPAGIEIAFTTDDVPAVFTHAVKTGAIEVTKPQIKPWGQQVAYVKDLDGVLVEIASPL
jgi:uncharacterized glyoxalase superfamily protein PhnB